jgi:hypothetical protein
MKKTFLRGLFYNVSKQQTAFSLLQMVD